MEGFRKTDSALSDLEAQEFPDLSSQDQQRITNYKCEYQKKRSERQDNCRQLPMNEVDSKTNNHVEYQH